MLKALGMITFASDVASCAELERYRSVGAFSFLGRYRIIDFAISNMSNSGINRINVHVRKKPRSLMNHIGSGRHFNINAKHGNISVLFGEQQYQSHLFYTDIASYYDNLDELESSRIPYVVITTGNVIARIDYTELLKTHVEQGNDITVLYKYSDNAKEQYLNCDTLALSKEKQVTQIGINHGVYKARNISLSTYVLSRELFISLIKEAKTLSSLYWFRDILNDKVNRLDIKGYACKGPVYIINSLESYFNANMDLLNFDKVKDLFKEDWPIYTRTNDSVPTIYAEAAEVKNSVISNGTKVNGTVINSIIGRGCVIEEGAVVENALILPGSVIKKDVKINYVIVDKKATIGKVKELIGTKDNLIYIERGGKV